MARPLGRPLRGSVPRGTGGALSHPPPSFGVWPLRRLSIWGSTTRPATSSGDEDLGPEKLDALAALSRTATGQVLDDGAGRATGIIGCRTETRHTDVHAPQRTENR